MVYVQSHKDLVVWQKSISLVKEVYLFTSHFPRSETYGLAAQMRRAAISIPSNIAEGYKRSTTGEYIHFLGIANASAAELETQVVISHELYADLEYSSVQAFLSEIQKMLAVMIKKLRLIS